MTRIECITHRFEEDYAKHYDLTLNDSIPVSARYKDINVQYYYKCYIAEFCNRLLDTGYDLDENNKFIKVLQ